jgi:peptide deformylase
LDLAKVRLAVACASHHPIEITNMSELELVTFPNSILARPTQEIDEVTPELVELAKDMIQKMYDVPGVGLAANQIGKGIRLAVIDTRKRSKEGKFRTDTLTEIEKGMTFPIIMFNPELLESTGESFQDEGCLSVPGYFDSVKRSGRVKFRYMDENGETQEKEVDGLTAICVQHEIDHLNGKLFLDRLTPIRRSIIKNKIKKYGYNPPEEEEAR